MRKPSLMRVSTSRPSFEREGQDLGAGALLEPGRAGRVVGVGVGAQDPADAIATAAGDGVEVRRVVGTRVDHRDLVDADEVGVGAGAGHDPGLGATMRRTKRAQGAGHTGHQRRRRSRCLFDLVSTGSSGLPAGHQLAVRRRTCADELVHRDALRQHDRHELVVAGVARQHDAIAARGPRRCGAGSWARRLMAAAACKQVVGASRTARGPRGCGWSGRSARTRRPGAARARRSGGSTGWRSPRGRRAAAPGPRAPRPRRTGCRSGGARPRA